MFLVGPKALALEILCNWEAGVNQGSRGEEPGDRDREHAEPAA